MGSPISAISLLLSCCALLCATGLARDAASASWGPGKALLLCYHDISEKAAPDDPYAVQASALREQIAFLKNQGCSFVSAKELLAAAEGRSELPPKAVMLCFDDAYGSFSSLVLPFLKGERIPCLLSVVGAWADSGPPPDLKDKKLMSWAQIKEAAASGFVEVASHSYALHRGVQCNPQGGEAPAAVNLIYFKDRGAYESEGEARARIAADLRRSFKAIEENAGVKPLFLAWPYGLHSQMAREEAAKAGFKMTLSLDDGLFDAKAKDASSAVVPRHMAMGGQSLKDFAADWQRLFLPRLPPFRALQTDLDLVWDANPAQQEENLDAFVERLAQISPGTVLLQAYSDDLADGNVRSVYFPNRTLPMKADLFNRACRSLQGRGMKVFAWMPSLAIVLPDAGAEAKLRVMEAKGGAARPSRSWYSRRLSPFSEEAATKLKDLYAALAASAPIDGVIFQDDCYLNDFEDFNPAAVAAAKARRIVLNASGTPRASDMKNWTKLKTGRLNQLTLKLAAEVRRYRPDALFARTLYAPVVEQPKSEEWFAQSYPDSLRLYDYAVVMAYPKMEKVKDGEAWLAKLVESAKKNDPALSKTVFKLQSYDWEAKKWIDKELFRRWVEALKRAGAENLAYYPDDYSVSRPEALEIKKLLFEKDELPLAK